MEEDYKYKSLKNYKQLLLQPRKIRRRYYAIIVDLIIWLVNVGHLVLPHSMHDSCDLVHQEEDLELVATHDELPSSHFAKATLLILQNNTEEILF